MPQFSPRTMNDISDSLLPSTATSVPKRHSSTAAGRCKLWALSAILLLALWSMLAGSVTLKRSSLRRFDDDLGGPALDDLDILEMEEREKVVRRMWDVYRSTARLPKFWQQAFEAAYQELAGDDPDSGPPPSQRLPGSPCGWPTSIHSHNTPRILNRRSKKRMQMARRNLTRHRRQLKLNDGGRSDFFSKTTDSM